jgi:serine/threonine protein kinase
MIGKTISHYKIIEKLGEGGMGVVYKAEDTKLKRTVALKFLPPELTRDIEAKERFVQEAQAASSLQHRNICTIHEIDETEDGQVFICMDVYQGESLGERIKHRPLRIDDAIDIASQIARGLAGAHKAGIVHRDIKPVNILITDQNEVKIIDFGLAKLTGGTKFTQKGATVGTAAYMSPEQLRGEKVDHRSDIWALGVVMYQMLTGLLPFKGEYEQAISYSILNEEPEPITSLRTGVPLELERIVMKALAKDSGHRYQHVDEVPADLDSIETSSGAVSRISAQTKATSTTSRLIEWKKVMWLLLAALFMGAILTTVLLKLVSSESEPFANAMRFALDSTGELGRHQAISAGGKHIVYEGFDGEKWSFYLRNLNQFEEKPIATNGRYPFFSPDGKWLAFYKEGILYKTLVLGGPLIKITEPPIGMRGGFWSPDDSITFATLSDLYKVSADGSNLHVITKTPSGKTRFPSPLPGGKAILCTIWNGVPELAQIGLIDLQTDSLRVLFENGTTPHYSYSGHIVYSTADGVLMAAPFDKKRLRVTGQVVPTSEKIGVNRATGKASYSLSQNGSLLYLSSISKSDYNNTTVVTVDRQGNEQPLITKPGDYNYPHYSRDGTQLAILLWDSNVNSIWIYDNEKGEFSSQLTIGNSYVNPKWTSDSTIVFSSVMGGDFDICQILANGTAPLDTIFNEKGYQKFNSISRDGQWLLFTNFAKKTKNDIWALRRDGKSEPEPLIRTPFDEDFAEISPNGRWVAYHSNETGQYEVYVRSFPYPNVFKRKITSDGGWSPVWSPDGKELFYSWNKAMYSVEVETEPEFKQFETKVLFGGRYNWGWTTGRTWDIHPEGKKFVMIKPGKRDPRRMFVVLNWFEELKQLAPTD